jgi:uncharacterized protein (TIGR04255 family)
MTTSLPSPLGGRAPAELTLARPPLSRVVVQARFSSVLKIDGRDGVAPFQELVRADYPLLEEVTAHQLKFDMSAGAGAFNPVTNKVWRFSDAARTVTLSLTTDAVTLEARAYPGRVAFMARWASVLERLEQVFAPGLVLRTGVRYLNRLNGDSLERLPEWVRSSLIGVAQPELRAHVTQAISEANLQVEEGSLLLRWGILSPGSTIDPGLLEPVDMPSWILDIDAFSTAQAPFAAAALAQAYDRLAERAYAIFRWVITDAGLTHFGATS